MLVHCSNGLLTLEVQTKGAELYALHTEEEPQGGWLWDGKEAWPRRAPVCFPWCGRCKDGFFEEQGRRYSAGTHGLLRDLEHTLVSQTADCVRLQARSDDALLAQWPWPFSAETEHKLDGHIVTTTVTVTNLGKQPMPYQLGFHTGLRCPFTEGQRPEDYQLRFEVEESPQELLCDGGLITGEKRPVFTGCTVVPLRTDLFDQDSICLTGLRSRWVRLEEIKTGRYLQLDLDAPYVLLWSKPGIPGFICIEPWSGLPSRVDGGHSLWERPGTARLEPGECASAVQRLTVGK